MFFCPVQQKSLREKWLLDGAAGSEQDEAKKQLAEDETKLKGMEESIIRYVYNPGTLVYLLPLYVSGFTLYL